MSVEAISRPALFEVLARGHAAKCAVLTPNTRLAQALMQAFDARQVAQGLGSWEAPDILPAGSFFERLWDDAMHEDTGAPLPMLLTSLQEQHLWEEAIRGSARGSALLAPAQTALQCRDAWRLAHAWRITRSGGNEDADAFGEWSRAYLKLAGGDIDAARLPELAAGLVDADKVRTLVIHAFDILPPQTTDFLAACAARGIEVRRCASPRIASTPRRAMFASARDELEAVAAWARSRLDAGARRIGVVVPDLQARRREIARVFTRVMGSPAPFNISLGQALADYPLVDAALSIIGIAHREAEFAVASRIVRSPFIGGAVSEMAARARLDARLRRTLPAMLTLARLVGAVQACPLLRRHLEGLYAVAVSQPSPERGGGGGAELVRGSPHDWSRHFSALLDAAGFPGERVLDSTEFQTLAKWNETLAELARLERVAPRMSLAQALAKLRRLCAETLFQPESPASPVQVLGILESAGLDFEHLWVTGLSDDAWPLDARPNPFIPVALQKRAGIPAASAEASFELDRRMTDGWLGAAREVVVSHPSRAEDRELAVSPLIAGIPEGAPGHAAIPRHRDQLFAARELETVADGGAPALVAKAVHGGARVLADQAACPFRAFARHRLGARALEEPDPAPGALERGMLLHELMKRLWDALKGSAALAGDVEGAIAKAAAEAVDALAIAGRMAELERARMARLAREWLEVERRRAPFEVVATEQDRALVIGPLALSGRIDRLDRLADGSHALIDYKAGKVSRTDWMGERPNDPQVPLYAVTAAEEIGAVAFARLKTGEMKFSGYAREKDLVERARDWPGLLAGWKSELERLGNGFHGGDARVDPKKGLATCRLCDLQPLCRVHEKIGLSADPGAGEDE